jgi:hypothetical protein
MASSTRISRLAEDGAVDKIQGGRGEDKKCAVHIMMMFGLWLLTVLVGTGVVLAVVYVCNRPRPCPVCGVKALEHVGFKLVLYNVALGAPRPPDPPEERSYRCSACSAEFFRQGKGALVGKDAWEAGARDTIPQARAKVGSARHRDPSR